MVQRRQRKTRKSIAKPTRRSLLLETGFRCSLRGCYVDSSLEFHHIDGNPSNNSVGNLLVLCSNHHTLATKGIIDRKACTELKKNLGNDGGLLSGNKDFNRFRRIIREELKGKNAQEFQPVKTKNIFPSRFGRSRLFKVLKFPEYHSTKDIYFCILVLGELKLRGSTKVIINAIEKQRANKRIKKKVFLHDFYIPGIEALSKIGTKSAILWLAREIDKWERPALEQFLLFLAVLGSENSKKYISIQKIEKTKISQGGEKTIQKIYTIHGKQFVLG